MEVVREDLERTTALTYWSQAMQFRAAGAVGTAADSANSVVRSREVFYRQSRPPACRTFLSPVAASGVPALPFVYILHVADV